MVNQHLMLLVQRLKLVDQVVQKRIRHLDLELDSRLDQKCRVQCAVQYEIVESLVVLDFLDKMVYALLKRGLESKIRVDFLNIDLEVQLITLDILSMNCVMLVLVAKRFVASQLEHVA